MLTSGSSLADSDRSQRSSNNWDYSDGIVSLVTPNVLLDERHLGNLHPSDAPGSRCRDPRQKIHN